MSRIKLKQLIGKTEGSILFSSANNIITEDFNSLNWDYVNNELNVNGKVNVSNINISSISINETSNNFLVSDLNGDISYRSSVIYNDLDNTPNIETLDVDSIILTSFDEFGYDTRVKSSTTSQKHFNAIYEWLVLQNILPTKTDFSYTIEEDLSRIGQVKNCLFWVNWFCEGNSNPNKIRPALQDSIKIEISATDWISGGFSASSTDIINIPSAYSISGSQNDSSLIRGMLAIQERGYKPGFIPITRYIDTTLQKEYWRGTISWNDSLAFDAWIADYSTFYKHYIDLFYNNGIDLGITYLGSEMAELSKSTFNNEFQTKWVKLLVDLAAYSKEKFPNCIVTYAADWTEYRTNLDKLWVDKNIDRIGIEFYLPILSKHSNNAYDIGKGMWEGEGIDYFLSNYDYTERFAKTSNGEGKINLAKNTPIAKSAQLNNWREWRDNPHYFNKRTGAIADASPFFNEEHINQIYDDNSSSIMTGTAPIKTTMDVSIFDSFQTGPNKRLFPENCWLDCNATNYGRFQLPSKALADTTPIDEFKLSIDFSVDVGASHSSAFPRLIRFNNWLDIFLDTGTLKVEYKQATQNAFANIIAINGNYNGDHLLNISIIKGQGTTYVATIEYNGELSSQTSFDLTIDNLNAIFTTPDIYVGSFSGTSDFIVGKYYKIGYYFKAGIEYYGGTYNFEDDIFGVRNEYDARFELNREYPVMATEVGVASINGSLVEPNVFPFAKEGTGYIPQNKTQEYWQDVTNYGLTIENITGPYGSTFEVDEIHQKVGISTIIPRLKEAGVKETALYNLDTRYYKSFKGIENGVLWYKDAGNHIYNHALNGKKLLGYDTDIYTLINPNNLEPVAITITLDNDTYNRENTVNITSTELLPEYNPQNTIGAYYKLDGNTADDFGNFVSGTVEGGTVYNKIDNETVLSLDGIDDRFIANTYTALGLMGNSGNNDYTVGIIVNFETLPAQDEWIWSAYNTTGTNGTGVKIKTDGRIEFHRGTDILTSTITITTNKLTAVYVRYNYDAGITEIIIDGVIDTSGTSTTIQNIAVVDDIPIYIGYHQSTNTYTKIDVSRFRITNQILKYLEIEGLSEITKYDIVIEDQINAGTNYIIPQEWILKLTNTELIFTIPPDFTYGTYRLFLRNIDNERTRKFDFVVQEIVMESGFVETFANTTIFNERWEAINRGWGGDNGGVVSENVYIDTHLGESVLVLEAHGDNYTGDVQGVDSDGNPKFNPDGTPWTKRVGGVAVSKNYVGYGLFEYEAKVVPVLGVASAFWNFHYQEIYPDDPRWDKFTGDYVRSGLTQSGLKSQFNTLQHQNPNTAGTDTSTSFITDSTNTTYGLGIKGEPNTIGETLRYQGNTGYAIDLLNTSIIDNPLSTDWLVTFWVKVDLEAQNNARHAIISQGNGLSSLGAQAHYFSTYYEIQSGIRTDTDSAVLFGTNVQANYGEWYHVAFGVKSGQLIQYINGDEKASAAVPTGTFTAQSWWRAIQNLAFAGGSAGTNPKDMSISDIRIIKGYHPTLREIRTHYGRPYFIGDLDFTYKNLRVSGDETTGFYVVRNNEIDIEVPSHLEGGNIEMPSLANAKFNTWRGELKNWSVTNENNYQYWEEFRDNYRPMNIDVTDGQYHKFRYDWYPNRVDFYIDDVLVISNTDFMFGIDSLNIPETATKMTLGPWFPSGGTLWAGTSANFDVEKMYVRRITYTPYQTEIDNNLIKTGETYPNTPVRSINKYTK